MSPEDLSAPTQAHGGDRSAVVSVFLKVGGEVICTANEMTSVARESPLGTKEAGVLDAREHSSFWHAIALARRDMKE